MLFKDLLCLQCPVGNKKHKAAAAAAVRLRIAADGGADAVPVEQMFGALCIGQGVKMKKRLHNASSFHPKFRGSFTASMQTMTDLFILFSSKRIDEKEKIVYNQL